MRRLLYCALAAAAILTLVSCMGKDADVEAPSPRRLEGGALISSANPKASITPSPEFDYAGRFSIVLKDTAHAERYHWVVAEDGKVRKLLIVQFEGFLDGVDGRYEFVVPSSDLAGSNYKFSEAPVVLGGVGFIHNTWAFDHAAEARANPGMEAAATLAMLHEKGYEVEDALIMSRFVQAFGEDGRHEMIIFYLEPLSADGKTLAEFPDGEPLTEAYSTYSDAVAARSLESFDAEFMRD